MAFKFSKLKLIDRILLVSGAILLFLFAIYLIIDKRPNRKYFIPSGYNGWLTVHFEEEGAPEMERIEGTHYIYFNDSGYAFYSNRLDKGWGRDEFYWKDGDRVEKIEWKDGAEGKENYVHGKYMEFQDFDESLIAAPYNAETELWDGTVIEKADTTAEVDRGRRVNLHIFVADTPKSTLFTAPEVPKKRNKRPLRK